MNLNWAGLVAGIVTFLSIWFGHVAVRKIEFTSRTIWVPMFMFVAVGIFSETISLSVSNPLASVVFGILGITLLWDALEFTRQQRRVMKGHAPANPLNPRHARILSNYSTATILDLLKREPAYPVNGQGHRKAQS